MTKRIMMSLLCGAVTMVSGCVRTVTYEALAREYRDLHAADVHQSLPPDLWYQGTHERYDYFRLCMMMMSSRRYRVPQEARSIKDRQPYSDNRTAWIKVIPRENQFVELPALGEWWSDDVPRPD